MENITRYGDDLSVSKWKYTEECEGDYCCGDCDLCDKEPEESEEETECTVCSSVHDAVGK